MLPYVHLQDKYTQLLVVKFTVSTLDNCFKTYIWIRDVFDVDWIWLNTIETVCLFVCNFLFVHAVCQEPIKDAKGYQMPWFVSKNLPIFLGEAPRPPNERGDTPLSYPPHTPLACRWSKGPLGGIFLTLSNHIPGCGQLHRKKDNSSDLLGKLMHGQMITWCPWTVTKLKTWSCASHTSVLNACNKTGWLWGWMCESYETPGCDTHKRPQVAGTYQLCVWQGSSRLYFLRMLRWAGMDPKDIVATYVALMCSILEYVCQVWHTGLTVQQSDQLELVQQSALRVAYPDHSYRVTLQIAGVDTLCDRPDWLCRAFVANILEPAHLLHPLLSAAQQHSYICRDWAKCRTVVGSVIKFGGVCAGPPPLPCGCAT